MTVNYNPPIVTSGLVLNLDAANRRSYPGTGTVWNDLSGNNNHGTLTNGPTYSSANGGSIVFDGTNDYIEGVHNSQLDITGDLTVECWFRITNSRGDWVRILGKGTNTNRTYSLWFHQTGDPTPSFLYQRYGAGGDINLKYFITPQLNTWYHMVGTSFGSSHKLYLNNQLVAQSNNFTSFYSSTDPYKIGYGNIHTYHIGNVSNCRIYNRALSASEIAQNFNALRGRFGI